MSNNQTYTSLFLKFYSTMYFQAFAAALTVSVTLNFLLPHTANADPKPTTSFYEHVSATIASPSPTKTTVQTMGSTDDNCLFDLTDEQLKWLKEFSDNEDIDNECKVFFLIPCQAHLQRQLFITVIRQK